MQWTAEIRRRVSGDGGRTWGPVETFAGQPGSFCRNPMVVLSNGDWIFPMFYSLPDAGHGGDYTVMMVSNDGGESWAEHPVPECRGRVHASVVELASGRLMTFMRSRAADRIYVSRSVDFGRTWTPPEPTALPNNNASIQALKLTSGALVIAYNSLSANDDPTKTIWPRRRYPLTVALSEDAGETWPFMRHIDTSDGFCGVGNAQLNRRCAYPSIVQTSDGLIHIAYSYRDRQCIKYVRISEAWIRDQHDTVYRGVI
jgi:predicted neuraminidase